MMDKLKETGRRIWGGMDERKLLAAGLISLLVLLAAFSRGIRPASWEEINGQKVNQFAWWGCLYPYTCLEGAMYLVEEPQGQEEGMVPEEGQEVRIPGQELPVKIKWKCMDLF